MWEILKEKKISRLQLDLNLIMDIIWVGKRWVSVKYFVEWTFRYGACWTFLPKLENICTCLERESGKVSAPHPKPKLKFCRHYFGWLLVQFVDNHAAPRLLWPGRWLCTPGTHQAGSPPAQPNRLYEVLISNIIILFSFHILLFFFRKIVMNIVLFWSLLFILFLQGLYHANAAVASGGLATPWAAPQARALMSRRRWHILDII